MNLTTGLPFASEDSLAVAAKASASHELALVAQEKPQQGQDWNFAAKRFPGFYAAGGDKTKVYDFARIIRDVPAIWDRPWNQDMRPPGTGAARQKPSQTSGETYGELFKRIGTEIGADPYALAAFCIFESYNSNRHTFNPRMHDVAGNMHAAGIAATQAQDWKGRRIPGLEQRFPTTTRATSVLLRQRPDYALRCLAHEFKQAYQQNGQDLSRTFPKVAYPAWGAPSRSRGAYGKQAQYVSRAYALYQAFQQADKAKTGKLAI